MKIAFYYHVSAVIQSDKILLPGYFGIFIEALAENCEALYYVFHQATEVEKKEADYALTAKNIKYIDLGVKTPAWHRELFHKKILKKKLEEIEDCDVLIVRSPTPLASYFRRYVHKPVIWYMIVGDYLKAIDHYKESNFRDKLIYYYLHVNDFFFQRTIKGARIVVNSPALFEKYAPSNPNVFQIKTTTLRDSDFFYREDTCGEQVINILYTGAYNPSKGVFELIEAIDILIKSNKSVHLHLVGWEVEADKPVEKAMRERARTFGVENHITIHGKKKVGDELNLMYRMADIYVMPTYHEGFPRTIWEAMANGLPVVASAVGGIPKFLRNEEHALLIEPKDRHLIAQAVNKLIEDSELRQRLILNSFNLVKDVTLEVQTRKLVEILKDH